LIVRKQKNVTRRRLGFASGAVVALFLLVGAAQMGGAAAAVKGPSSTAEHSRQAERVRDTIRMLDGATVDADGAAMRRLLADDFQLINPLGVPTSREEYIGSVVGGQLDFLSFEVASDIVVRLYDDGDAAVARYKSSIDLAAFGQRLTHEAMHTDLLERNRGRWQVVWAQTTAIPNNPGLVIEALKRAS
jgi:uncharacterized protein DUF4440